MRKVLSQSFFNRSPQVVARDLIGKFLVREDGGIAMDAMITETEAYDGERDLACHAAKGRTTRTETLYGKPGHFYVYLIYGMYYLLNVVVREEGYPAGVLIRAVEGVSGPGRLTKQLQIGKKFHAATVARSTGLWIEDRGVKISPRSILRTPRIGVEYAGPVWSMKRWRYVYKNSQAS